MTSQTPDIAPEIATALAVPFERMPFFGVRLVRKHEALELKTAEILEMDRLNILGGLDPPSPSPPHGIRCGAAMLMNSRDVITFVFFQNFGKCR